MRSPTWILALGLALAPLPLHAQEDGGVAGECGDLLANLRNIRQALDEVRLNDALVHARKAENDLICQPKVVSTMLLTTLYQTVGAVYQFRGEPSMAELYFGRALAVAPAGSIDATLGPQVAEQFELVRDRVLAATPGSVQANPDATAWVDGRSVSSAMPLELASGSHLVQVKISNGSLVNRVVRVGADERYTVSSEGQVSRRSSTGPIQATTPTPTSKSPTPTHPSVITSERPATTPHWALVGSGGAAVIAGALSLVVAASTEAQFSAATDPDALDDLRARTNTFSAVGASLEVVGLGLVGAGFAVPYLHGGNAGITFRW